MKVGDVVGFKCDVEQYGTITRIERDGFGNVTLTLEAFGKFTGEYIGGQQVTTERAAEFAGRLTLAKLDTDAEPELAAKYGIRGIPNVKVFVDGKVADEFTGALPERALREFIERVVPSPAAPLVAAAAAALITGRTRCARTRMARCVAT